MQSKLLLFFLILLFGIAGCSSHPTDPYNATADSSPEFSSQVMALSFEDCLTNATHVLSAVYTGEFKTHGPYCDLVFTPGKQYKGAAVSENFHVRIAAQSAAVSGADSTYTVSSSNCETGKTYLLVLEKQVSVYDPYDLYLPLGNIVAGDDADTITYISDYLAGCAQPPEALGTDFIRSSVLRDIVEGTSLIAKVTPTEYIGGSDSNQTDRYLCRVDHVIKGSADSTMKIIFFADTVEIGSQYVVMVEPLGGYFVLSSKASVYPTSDAAVVQQIESSVFAE